MLVDTESHGMSCRVLENGLMVGSKGEIFKEKGNDDNSNINRVLDQDAKDKGKTMGDTNQGGFCWF